ncbi:DUF563 domain-containing protein [Lichenibacterium minor]|uniref:DUF563 domain-containing protein n=1 Tax=Lichenibacterium minor TaxID=2316528 RepID=A0A4Q2U6X6_9HYPH|nr:glycosyltransferase 61 family protein [Lichenibacterium minor]RYC30841.1 DUF563 domain-containing protein [Lichenibacterium minor]
MRLVLRSTVDEVSTLPRVPTVAALAASPDSCSAELLPRRPEPAAELFPGATSRHGGEVPAPPWWSETEGYIGQLDAFKLTDVLLFPAWGVVVTPAGDVMRLTMEEAAYATPDLSGLPHAVRHGGDTVLDLPDDVPRVERALLTMPFGARMNYGHFVLDALSSLAALDATGLFAAHPVLVPPLKPWQARHFALMGAAPLVTAAPVVRVGELVYTGAVHHFLHNPNFNYRDLRARQLAALAPTGDGPRRLYLSRGRRDRRPMRSEARLVAALRRAGFAAVDTGRMSVDRQMALFAGAEAVVGAAGAAFANALYCRPGTAVVEIMPRGMENHWVQPLCRIGGLHHAAWFCGAEERDPAHPEQGMRFDVDVGRFLDFAFAEPPLAGTRHSASLARRVGLRLGLAR